jgi:hypothetical protein
MNKIMKTQKQIEKDVVAGYKSIENGVVSGYKKIEDGVVGGYKKIEDKFVKSFLPGDEKSEVKSENTGGDADVCD